MCTAILVIHRVRPIPRPAAIRPQRNNSGGAPWDSTRWTFAAVRARDPFEDAAFADVDLDGQPDGVVTATEGGNQHVKLHGMTSTGPGWGSRFPAKKTPTCRCVLRTSMVMAAPMSWPAASLSCPTATTRRPIGPQGCAPCDILHKLCADVAALWWWSVLK